jgi:ComF family protein
VQFRLLQIFGEYGRALVHLLYPHICLQCGTEKLSNHYPLCQPCIEALPYTDFFAMQDNPIEKIFWGRTELQVAGSLLFFTKDSIVQFLLFELKYKQNTKAGKLLGNLIGNAIANNSRFNSIDCLIPIPITKARHAKRGFNQAVLICEGILEMWPSKKIILGLKKSQSSKTQTHKDRLQRGKAIAASFTLDASKQLFAKNLLLVDDVITTGATIEAACLCLSDANPASISIASAAYTLN